MFREEEREKTNPPPTVDWTASRPQRAFDYHKCKGERETKQEWSCKREPRKAARCPKEKSFRASNQHVCKNEIKIPVNAKVNIRFLKLNSTALLHLLHCLIVVVPNDWLTPLQVQNTSTSRSFGCMIVVMRNQQWKPQWRLLQDNNPQSDTWPGNGSGYRGEGRQSVPPVDKSRQYSQLLLTYMHSQ